MRHGNLSGDDAGDFSLSSMSADSSHRANKSSLNRTSTNQGQQPGGGANNLERIFGKNYFVDGEQLLRHISPSQPTRSPRDSAAGGESGNALNTQCVNLLNMTDAGAPPTLSSSKDQHPLRLSNQNSTKRSKTTRA